MFIGLSQYIYKECVNRYARSISYRNILYVGRYISNLYDAVV